MASGSSRVTYLGAQSGVPASHPDAGERQLLKFLLKHAGRASRGRGALTSQADCKGSGRRQLDGKSQRDGSELVEPSLELTQITVDRELRQALGKVREVRNGRETPYRSHRRTADVGGS
jgi:hypothetical protein